jgi:hypothetical protein
LLLASYMYIACAYILDHRYKGSSGLNSEPRACPPSSPSGPNVSLLTCAELQDKVTAGDMSAEEIFKEHQTLSGLTARLAGRCVPLTRMMASYPFTRAVGSSPVTACLCALP